MRRFMQGVTVAILVAAPFAADAATKDFTVVNRTGFQIDRIFVSHSTDRQWGVDAMTAPKLDDGQRVRIPISADQRQCQYDLRVEYHDGQRATWAGLNLCYTPRVALFWNTKTRTTTAEAN